MWAQEGAEREEVNLTFVSFVSLALLLLLLLVIQSPALQFPLVQ